MLFFAIPEELSLGKSFQGVLLFVVLASCLIMAWSLISYKNKKPLQEEGDNLNQELDPDIEFSDSDKGLEKPENS